MIVRNDLHSLLNLFVAFVLKTLAVTILSSIDTATKVVVLRWRRRRSVKISIMSCLSDREDCLPVAIRWDDIVDPQLLTDLFDAQMQSVSFELLICHVGHDHGRKTHQSSSFILFRVTPSIALLALLRAIGIEFCRQLVESEYWGKLIDVPLAGLRPRL